MLEFTSDILLLVFYLFHLDFSFLFLSLSLFLPCCVLLEHPFIGSYLDLFIAIEYIAFFSFLSCCSRHYIYMCITQHMYWFLSFTTWCEVQLPYFIHISLCSSLLCIIILRVSVYISRIISNGVLFL